MILFLVTRDLGLAIDMKGKEKTYIIKRYKKMFPYGCVPVCMVEMCSSLICPIFVLCPSTEPVCNMFAVYYRTWVLSFQELKGVGRVVEPCFCN